MHPQVFYVDPYSLMLINGPERLSSLFYEKENPRKTGASCPRLDSNQHTG